MLELLKSGYRATVIDNFDNAFEACYERMKKLAGDKADKIKLIKVCVATSLRKHLRSAHFAAAAVVSNYSPFTIHASLQGDLRNFDDVDKALGTDKSVCFVVSFIVAVLDSSSSRCTWRGWGNDQQQWACRFDAVIHFAGRKAVGESVQSPMLYYTHNLVGAVNLIEACRKHNLKNVGCLPQCALRHFAVFCM